MILVISETRGNRTSYTVFFLSEKFVVCIQNVIHLEKYKFSTIFPTGIIRQSKFFAFPLKVKVIFCFTDDA